MTTVSDRAQTAGRLWRPVALVAVAGLALAAAACGGQTAPVAAAKAADQPGYFTVPATQRAQLQITKVAAADLPLDVQTTGTVDWDNDQTTQAITQVSGPIKRITVDTGAHVKAGAPLLYVASPDLSGAMSTYRSAENRLDLAKRSLARNRDLLAHHAIAMKDMESSQADYNDAQTTVQNALQTLRIYGVSAADIKSAEQQNAPIVPELAMRAPIAGTVVQKLVFPGQYIQAGTTAAFVISNVSTVWVQGNLYERDLKTVRVGNQVDITSPAYDRTFHGTVSYIGAMLDPATRTTPVRVVTTNPDGLLKKDQFVDLTIHSGAIRHTLVVPTSAILYNNENFPFVYLEAGPGRFAQRLVKIGVQQGDQFEILDGLKAGDSIVSEGSVFLQFAESNQQ
ncbi:MAG TPA: efflux RND transporter periplasmic adaptor subunit [Vicinamibacterales bacterium]|nr:efflux RND transporter periplasmic adaptor subunit [Vicinamibacterales bacterium]